MLGVAILTLVFAWSDQRRRLPNAQRRESSHRSITEEAYWAVASEWRWAKEHGDTTRQLRAEGEMHRLGAAVVPALIRLLDDWPEGAPHVAEVLGQIPAVATVEALARILAGAGPETRTVALHALARIGGDHARALFRDRFAREADPNVLSAALAVAPAILTPADLDHLPKGLASQVRDAIANRRDNAVDVEALHNTDATAWPAEKWAEFVEPGSSMTLAGIAAAKLEQRGDDDAVAVLRNTALRHDDIGARAFAALCRLRNNAARGAVRDVLASAPAERLPALLDLLGTYGDAAYLPVLAEMERSAADSSIATRLHRSILLLRMK